MNENQNYSEIEQQLSQTRSAVKDEFKHLSHEDHLNLHDESRLPYAVACVNVAEDSINTIIQSAAMLGCETVFIYGDKKIEQFDAGLARRYQRVEHINIDITDEQGTEELPPEVNYEILIQTLEVLGYTPFALDNTGARCDQIDFTVVENPCIVVGNDEHGLPQYLREELPKISIPQCGVLKSLNTGIAATIAMSRIQQQYLPKNHML